MAATFEVPERHSAPWLLVHTGCVCGSACEFSKDTSDDQGLLLLPSVQEERTKAEALS